MLKFTPFALMTFSALAVMSRIDTAAADGKPQVEIDSSRPTTRQNDQRLPPVLPGEEVVTQTGQRMRVWSSSGPVPVNPTPIPQPLPSGVGGAGLGVIVDSRDRYHKDGYNHLGR